MDEGKTSVEFTWEELAYACAALRFTLKRVKATKVPATEKDVEIMQRLNDRLIAAGVAMPVPANSKELIAAKKAEIRARRG